MSSEFLSTMAPALLTLKGKRQPLLYLKAVPNCGYWNGGVVGFVL